LILGLDRLLRRLLGGDDEQHSDPGLAVPDRELAGRIDAARVRLREEIAPLED
jgi:hypothetical protein